MLHSDQFDLYSFQQFFSFSLENQFHRYLEDHFYFKYIDLIQNLKFCQVGIGHTD